jgi:hypothetical protein
MHTRCTAWTFVVLLGQGLAGCGGSHSSSTPLSPSTLMPSPQPPVAAFAGNYLVTFEADRSCEELPDALKTRTYGASIASTGSGIGGPAGSPPTSMERGSRM